MTVIKEHKRIWKWLKKRVIRKDFESRGKTLIKGRKSKKESFNEVLEKQTLQ